MEDHQEEILETDHIGLHHQMGGDIVIILLQIFLGRLLDLGVRQGIESVCDVAAVTRVQHVKLIQNFAKPFAGSVT